MGYKRPAKTFHLKFTGELEGLEVHVKSITLGEMFELDGLLAGNDKTPTAEEVSAVFKSFAKALMSWNLEDDNDQPVPATLEGIYTQDMEFIMEIIAAWMEAVTGVDGDLGKGSIVGGQSLEELTLPMETLS